MIEIILDTNVLVSALLSPFGIPARILDLILSQQIVLRYDSRIWMEYEAVLARPRFGFNPVLVRQLLDYLLEISFPAIPEPYEKCCHDLFDQAFYEVRRSTGGWLVTGNLMHYPEAPAILSPADFMTKVEHL